VSVMGKYEACPESKDTSRVGRKEIFYAYYRAVKVFMQNRYSAAFSGADVAAIN